MGALRSHMAVGRRSGIKKAIILDISVELWQSRSAPESESVGKGFTTIKIATKHQKFAPRRALRKYQTCVHDFFTNTIFEMGPSPFRVRLEF